MARPLKERLEEAIWVVLFGGLPYGWKRPKRPTRFQGLRSRLQTGVKKGESDEGD